MIDNVLGWTRGVLTGTPVRWLELTKTLPEELLKQPPAVGEWSAVECLQHIVDTEGVFASRFKHFMAGEDFPAFNPDKQGTKAGAKSPAELAAEFDRLRTENLALYAQITAADLTRHA